MGAKKVKKQWMALLLTGMPNSGSIARAAEEPTIYQGTGFETAS